MSQLYNTVPSFESQVNTLVIWKVVPIYLDKGGTMNPHCNVWFVISFSRKVITKKNYKNGKNTLLDLR